MREALQLNGMKFGRLTVVERLANRGRDVYWKCKCYCGGEKEVSTKNLRNGKVKSCGCLMKEASTKAISDFNASNAVKRRSGRSLMFSYDFYDIHDE